MFEISNFPELTDLINLYSNSLTQSNNYLLGVAFDDLIKQRKLFYIKGKFNLYLLVDRNISYQLYYFINNFQESFKNNIDKPLVIEVVYKGEIKKPRAIIDYFELNGFSTHLTRDNMALSFTNEVTFRPHNINAHIKIANTKYEASYVCDLFASQLDIYTGDLKTQKEINKYIENGNILCAYYNDNLCGALQFEIKNKVNWLGHLAVDLHYRGNGIASLLVENYLKIGVAKSDTRFQLWVINSNESAVNLYKKFRFTHTGKSTISMLKLK